MQHRTLTARRSAPVDVTPVVGAVLVAWAVIVWSAASGIGALVRHDHLIRGGLPSWGAILPFLGGWQVMLWAMMVPASLGATRWREKLREKGPFGLGFLGVWTAFGLGAFYFDVAVHTTVSHSPWLALHPWLVAGSLLLFAGAYQLSRVKSRSLEECRRLEAEPASPGARRLDSLVEGVVYGLRCVGVSGALMLVAFAFAMGSIVMMVALTALMVWEATPWGGRTIALVGYCLIAGGAVVLAGPLQGMPLWVG